MVWLKQRLGSTKGTSLKIPAKIDGFRHVSRAVCISNPEENIASILENDFAEKKHRRYRVFGVWTTGEAQFRATGSRTANPNRRRQRATQSHRKRTSIASNPSDRHRRRLLADFEELWQTIQPRKQVRRTSLLVDRVDFDGVAGNVGITIHDTGMQSLTAGNLEVPA